MPRLPLPVLALLSTSLLWGCGQAELEPPLSLDVHTAVVWRCHHPGSTTLHDIQQRSHMLQLDVLSVRAQWIELAASSSHSVVLKSSGLSGCEQLAKLSDLVKTELAENWASLKYHSLHHSFGNSSFLKRLRRGAACDEECKEDWFSSYHNFSAIHNWYYHLAEQYPSRVVLNTSIGQTYYERNIVALHISDFSVHRRKSKIYLQCLLHSREWISGPVCMYIARHLASVTESDRVLTDLLKELEFIIVPVANPDGYYLTWLHYPKYRLWRKNGSPQSGTECIGVDLNRNFDAHWNEEDSESNPCSDLYSGTLAASELETRAITAHIERNGPLIGAIDFHSYHQEVLYPPAWRAGAVQETPTMDYVAKWVAAAAGQVGKSYTSQSMNSVYLASGTFADWALDHGRRGARYGWSCNIPLTVELRPEPHPKNVYAGFMLPTSEILPTCQEMVPAVLKFAALVLEKTRDCYM